MTCRHTMARVVIVLSLGCLAAAEVRAQAICQSLQSNYDFAGWQASGQTGAGTWYCNPHTGNPVFVASPDAYIGALRRAPEDANLEVRLQFNVFSPDGTSEDGLSLLLHWRDPILPTGCCEPIRGSGLRVLFSLARGRMEVYQETAGTSVGPVATLPLVLSSALQELRVAYRGPLLTVTHYGASVTVGTVEVPITPPGRFGFEFRGIQSVFLPTITADCTAPGDYDCDGISDAQDVCPQNADPGQEDFDGDGHGNACDFDDDADGVPDDTDLCPLASNPDQSDADGDQLGDACDACPTDASNDVDTDGICGVSDNCPSTANADQFDFDADGQGDLCDTNDGRILLRWSDPTRLDWAFESNYTIHHIYRGDLDVLRTTGVYVTDPQFPGPLDLRSCSRYNSLWVETETPPPGQGMFFHVTGSRNGVESGLDPDSEGTERPNDHACLAECDQPFTTVLNADGPATEQYRVIDNLADWCAFRPSACGSGLIDFQTEIAVVAAIGTKPDTCYGVQFTCMRRNGATGGVIVETQQMFPGPGCGCFTVITSPMTVAKLPRPAGPVTFSNGSAPLICP